MTNEIQISIQLTLTTFSQITIGTGAFLNINTGNKSKGSENGASPLVAWDLSSKKKRPSRVFYTERGFTESSTLIKFALTVGLCSNLRDLSNMAFSVSDTGGVFFIPKFSSMAGFVGFKNSSTKEHLVRAILEAIVFNIASFFFLTKEETSHHFDKLRIDGGISQNDFICQLIADLINVKIERSINCELTSFGVAYLSAYICGEGLKELEHAADLYEVERVFHPNEANRKELFMRYKKFDEISKQFTK
jgi:putative glycerol kinase 5